MGQAAQMGSRGTVSLQVIRKDHAIPEQFRNWKPKSDIGQYVLGCLRYLPAQVALGLVDRVSRIVVIETRLLLAHFREGLLLNDYGTVCERVVTTAGVNAIAARMVGAGTPAITAFNFHGIGTGSTAPAITDTALVTELTTQYNPDNTRATGAQSNPSANVYQSVATNTVDSAVAITEQGVFSQSATGGGTLLDRFTFSVVNLANGDSLQSTFQFTITAGG